MLDWLKGVLGKKEPEVDRAAMLEARPVRHHKIEWDEADDHVVLRVPTEGARVGKAPFEVPSAKEVALDEIGSGIWRRCDGEHTTADILAWMRDRWQFSYKEAEMGLATYLQTLGKRGFVLLAKPKGAETG